MAIDGLVVHSPRGGASPRVSCKTAVDGTPCKVCPPRTPPKPLVYNCQFGSVTTKAVLDCSSRMVAAYQCKPEDAPVQCTPATGSQPLAAGDSFTQADIPGDVLGVVFVLNCGAATIAGEHGTPVPVTGPYSQSYNDIFGSASGPVGSFTYAVTEGDGAIYYQYCA